MHKTISKLHLESVAHESLTAHCVHRAVAWSHLRKECIWVYLVRFIESGSDGPLDSRRISGKKKHGRCNHYRWVLSFPLLTSILCADYSSGENEMTAIYGDFYIFLDNWSAHRAKECICTWEESWRESSWNVLRYHWQIVGIKPEM